MRRLTTWSLWALVFSLPWEEAVAFEGLGTLSRLLGYATLAFGFVVAMFSHRLRGLRAPHVIAMAFIVWAAYTGSWSVMPDETWSRVLVYLRLAGFAWLIWEFAVSRDQQVKLMYAYVLGCGVSAAAVFVAVWEEKGLVSSAPIRFTGAGMNQNDLACILSLSMPMALHLATRPRGRAAAPPWPFLVYFGGALLAILYTGSRTGLVVLAVGLLMSALTAEGGRLKVRLYVASTLLGVLLASERLLPEGLQARLAGTGEEIMQGSWSQRKDIFAAAWAIAQEAPLTGVGAGAFPHAMLPRFGWASDAHNTYLNLLTGTGAVGLVLFLALPILLLRQALDLTPSERQLWVTLLLMWAVVGMSASWDGTKTTWLLLGLGFSWAMPLEARGQSRAVRLRLPGRRPTGKAT